MTPELMVLVTIIVATLILFWRVRRLNEAEAIGQPLAVPLRPIGPFLALDKQVGRAVESGRSLHVALGNGRLNDAAGPISVAALTILRHMATESCASNVPPIVTAGDATLTPAANEWVRQAYRRAGRAPLNAGRLAEAAQFVADRNYPQAYAAGVADVVHHTGVASSVLVGRYGVELALMTEAGTRANVPLIVGSDNPEALAIGAATTDELLIGEELLAAGAYLEGDAEHLAGVEAQDILRWLLSAIIVLVILGRLVTG